jgi:hypothetical protein
MHTHRIYPDRELHIPIRHQSWFIQLLMVLAVLILAGVVYGFWQISAPRAPGWQGSASDTEGSAPVNEQSQTGSRER